MLVCKVQIGYSLQDMGKNVGNRNIVHDPNLYGMWLYDYKNENAWTTREKTEKLTSRSFQGLTSQRSVPWLRVSKEEYR